MREVAGSPQAVIFFTLPSSRSWHISAWSSLSLARSAVLPLPAPSTQRRAQCGPRWESLAQEAAQGAACGISLLGSWLSAAQLLGSYSHRLPRAERSASHHLQPRRVTAPLTQAAWAPDTNFWAAFEEGKGSTRADSLDRLHSPESPGLELAFDPLNPSLAPVQQKPSFQIQSHLLRVMVKRGTNMKFSSCRTSHS